MGLDLLRQLMGRKVLGRPKDNLDRITYINKYFYVS